MDNPQQTRPRLTRRPRLLAAAVLALVLRAAGVADPAASPPEPDHLAAKPLFRDPVYDGAADPTVIWSPAHRLWYMFYTVRRANVAGLNGVAWVHGTPIGIATSVDGAAWKYLGEAQIDYPGAVAGVTWWAPAVVEHDGVFHMFVSYVPGIFADGWDHPREIVHCVSTDLVHWVYRSTLALSSHKVIDPGLLHLPGGGWRMWYKDERDGNSCHCADSRNLETWVDGSRVEGLSDEGGEAPLPFHWKGRYWLLRDITGGKHGLALYRSDDAIVWRRAGTLLQQPGTGADDTTVGHHPEVIISRGRAYLFYFVHPGAAGASAVDGRTRRSSIQVTELTVSPGNNTLTTDRNLPVMINLQPPPNVETESKFD